MLAGSRLGWFWIGCGLLALVLLIVLYRQERQLISRRAGVFLLGLRLAAAAALVLALFEPIAARTYREALRGLVIVGVDVSQSMETADPARSAEAIAALRKLLELGPGEAVERLSRREVARRLIEARSGPVGRLIDNHDVAAVAFARETVTASLPTLTEILKTPAAADDASRKMTNWEPVLARGLEGGDLAAPILAIVLLTDGHQNAPGEWGQTLDRLAARGVPVYPILIGSTVPPRDAAVAALKAPESVYRGDVASVAATLKIDGYAGRSIPVTLERPNSSPLRQTVLAPADEHAARPVVLFRVPMDEVGTWPVSVAVGPLEGDVLSDNDRRAVSIQVADDKASVLLVDGEARWEFRYVRNALARDARITLKSIVLKQPQPGEPLSRSYDAALPALPGASDPKPDPLGAFDALVLGDINPDELGPDGWRRVEAFVAERGGTLIFSPGPRYWAALTGQDTARKLLPVIGVQLAAIAEERSGTASDPLPPGARLTPTPAGLDATAWPMLHLAEAADQNLAIWAGLPRLPWVLAGRAKPGATALAAIAGDESAVVIAAQPYGLGKVFWVGTNGTWRWRYGVGDSYHHRFWGQVMRWASSGKLAAGNALVRFGPIAPRVVEGDGTTIQARLSEVTSGIGPNLMIAARLFRTDAKTGKATGEAVALVPLRPVVGQPRTFEGSAPPLPAGLFVIRIEVPELADSLRIDPARHSPVPEALLEVAVRETSERVELAATRDPLDRLAGATGGRVLADFEADQLAPLLRSRTREVTRTDETTLWDKPAALLLFFGLLTVEWVVRKHQGLP
jgi:hypothetical protein